MTSVIVKIYDLRVRSLFQLVIIWSFLFEKKKKKKKEISVAPEEARHTCPQLRPATPRPSPRHRAFAPK